MVVILREIPNHRMQRGAEWVDQYGVLIADLIRQTEDLGLVRHKIWGPASTGIGTMTDAQPGSQVTLGDVLAESVFPSLAVLADRIYTPRHAR